MKLISGIALFGTIALFGITGCAHRESQPAAGQYSDLSTMTPTSDSSAQRVYNTTITAPGGARGSVTQASNSPEGDGSIAEAVRKMVLSDPKLAPYPSKVTAMMDPDAKGKVTLTGSVPTEKVKGELVKRVREVPGVIDVEDRLVLEVPKSSRETDPADPNK